MDTYEHKHQDLGNKTEGGGVYKMAGDIAKALFRVMAQEGVVFTEAHFKTLLATYFQESRFEISKYVALSKLNGLEYNREKEINAVEAFQDAIEEAAEEFFENPLGVPAMSQWTTVRSVLPEFSEKFADAVMLDAQEA